MAQTNYTPISLYYSTTASAVPTAANLVQGELAINTNDGKLYYEDSSGVVQTLASKAGALGDVVGPASATDNALARFDLTTGKLIQNSVGILSDAGILTGLTGLTSSGSITLSSLTSGRVTYAGASGLLSDSSTLTYDGTSLTTPRLVLGGTTLPSAGTATLFSRTSDNNTYLQTGSGNNINFLDGSQNTLVSFSPASLSFNISNTNKLTLNSTSLCTASGVNVGIGTSSPNAKLQVTSSAFPVLKVADAVGGGALALGDEGTNNNYVGVWRGAANSISGGGFLNVQGNGIAFMSSDNVFGSASERMRIDSSGNVGIGTTTPTSYGALGVAKVITVNSLSGISAGFSDGTTGTLRIAHASGQNIINFDSGNLCFQGGGSGAPVERMRIDSSGNLLVNGTSTIGTGGKLMVTSTLDTLYAQSLASSAYAALVLNVQNTACNLASFQYGNTTNVGSITTNGTGVTYGTASDYRLKENVVPMTGALATVAQLKPVTYKWKSDGSDGQGFIAHELQAVVPDAVHGEKDAIHVDGKPVYQNVDTSFLVATLVSAIQELKAEFDAYKATHP